jgi:2-oxoglutarate dehydrogenase E2 component (dihydrolipoamide succinyltransferase)
LSLVDIAMPADLEGTKCVVRNWLKKLGDAVAADEPLVELETDKVSMEVFSPVAGTLREILMESGAEAGPGDVLGRMSDEVDAIPAPPASALSEPARASAPATGAIAASWGPQIADFDPALRLSPSVRRLLRETGAEPGAIVGTGRGGRLTRDDVRRHLERPTAVTEAPVRPPAAQSAADRQSPASHRIPHNAMRLRIAEHMTRSVSTAPHVTAVFEADFGAIMAHRKATKPEFEERGVNLTYTAYIVAAAVQAMAVAPRVNSRWHEDALEIFDDINIGVGASLGDKGLIVPVVHKAQALSLLGIAARLQEMTEGARTGKLRPADVQGGTFSISNHGVSGSLVATPIIINQPQSAILGVGKLEKRVVVREIDGADVIAIRPMAFVSLTIDHRVLDGHQTNAWLSRFVEVLQTWPSP